MDPVLVTVPEACRALGVGQTKLYELLGANRLRARKLGKRLLVETASIRELADSLPIADIRTGRGATDRAVEATR